MITHVETPTLPRISNMTCTTCSLSGLVFLRHQHGFLRHILTIPSEGNWRGAGWDGMWLVESARAPLCSAKWSARAVHPPRRIPSHLFINQPTLHGNRKIRGGVGCGTTHYTTPPQLQPTPSKVFDQYSVKLLDAAMLGRVVGEDGIGWAQHVAQLGLHSLQ